MFPDIAARPRFALDTTSALVDTTDAKGQGPEVTAWEAEINARVARLYGLTETEVAAIEGPQAGTMKSEGEEATA